MPIQIRAQEPLRKVLENQSLVEIRASSIAAAIDELETLYPGVKPRLLDEHGAVRKFVNIYVNEENIRFLQDQETPLKDGDEVSIVPSTAGG